MKKSKKFNSDFQNFFKKIDVIFGVFSIQVIKFYIASATKDHISIFAIFKFFLNVL